MRRVLFMIMLSVIMLSVVMLSVVMLSVVMLSVIMLSVVAPTNTCHVGSKMILFPTRFCFTLRSRHLTVNSKLARLYLQPGNAKGGSITVPLIS
jgi:hypothetical protein